MTLRQLLHRHRFLDSAFNAAGLVVEQACACGEHRHRRFADLGRFGDPAHWHKGALPFSARRVPVESASRAA